MLFDRYEIYYRCRLMLEKVRLFLRTLAGAATLGGLIGVGLFLAIVALMDRSHEKLPEKEIPTASRPAAESESFFNPVQLLDAPATRKSQVP